MTTPATLRARTVKDLAAMAKRKGVPGWHSMRKDQLVKSLLKLARSEAAKAARKAASSGKRGRSKSSSAGRPSKTRKPFRTEKFPVFFSYAAYSKVFKVRFQYIVCMS